MRSEPAGRAARARSGSSPCPSMAATALSIRLISARRICCAIERRRGRRAGRARPPSGSRGSPSYSASTESTTSPNSTGCGRDLGHSREARELVDELLQPADLALDRGRRLEQDLIQIGAPSRRTSCAAAAPQSWIGVSGFLISWAMRRATSRQASGRWARSRSVRSSTITSVPRSSPGRSAQRRDLHGDVQRRPRSRRSSRSRRRLSPPARQRLVEQLGQRLEAVPSGAPPGRRRPTSSVDVQDRAATAGLAVVTRPSGSSEITRGRQIGHQRLDVAPPLVERAVRPPQVGRRAGDHRAVLLQLAGHLVERIDQHAHLVADLRRAPARRGCPAEISRAAAAISWIGSVMRRDR